MSKLTLRIVYLATLASLAGCYQKWMVLQADAVSMTQTDAGESKSLKVLGSVEEKWCQGDDLALTSQKDRIGLADQVIYKAQGGGNKADFITDVVIYRDSDGCALLSGKLAKR